MSRILPLKGIVLRVTNYSETSIICDIYTNELGTQGYIVGGVRTDKKNSIKGVFFQPSALLDLVAYNNESKNLNRIKEFRWDYLYQKIFFNVFRNAVALFIVELMTRTLRRPDYNPSLYDFTRSVLIATDTEDNSIFANLPLYFMVHLIQMLGFKIDEEDFQTHILATNSSEACITQAKRLIAIQQISELSEIKINRHLRHELFQLLHHYYRTHIYDFGEVKSYSILRTVFQD